jgi:hypothetical protein
MWRESENTASKLNTSACANVSAETSKKVANSNFIGVRASEPFIKTNKKAAISIFEQSDNVPAPDRTWAAILTASAVNSVASVTLPAAVANLAKVCEAST